MTIFKPFGKRILIRKVKSESTPGRIILTNSKENLEGFILEVGSEIDTSIGNPKAGDKIFYSTYATLEEIKLPSETETLYLIHEKDILGKYI